jgi:putative transposase
MHITYKYRCYPTKSQIKNIDFQLEICRKVYNKTRQFRIDFYKRNKKDLSLFQCQKELTQWKKQNTEFKLVHSQVLQIVQDRVDLAFKGFFRRLRDKNDNKNLGFPKEKDVGRFRSLIYRQSGFKFFSKYIHLSKIGKIKTVFHRQIEGKIKRVSLVKYPSGKYFFCISVDISNIKLNNRIEKLDSVGIDLGCCNYAVLSDGVVVDNPKFLKNSLSKLKKLQSKNKKESVTRLHEKINNQRNDFLHKLTNKIIKSYNTICVENLNIDYIIKNGFNKDFRRTILDNGWSIFINMLKYKAVMAGRQLILVDPKHTSQTCSKCGSIKKLELSERSYYCESCGLLIDRDLNASYNILRLGLAQVSKLAGNTAKSPRL